MISKLLPEYCLPLLPLPHVKGVILHYFSAINVTDELNQFNKHECRKLILDLNRSKDEREWFMKGEKWPDVRMYASAHLLIGRGGEIWKLASFDQQAYHCGAGILNNRNHCNQWTLGIEMIGHQHSGFTREQYYSLAGVLAQLESVYGFSRRNVAGHDTVRYAAIQSAPHKKYKYKYDPSGRKDGEGNNFDWFYLGKLWNELRPNPEGVVGLERLDDVIRADPLSG